VAEGKQRQAMFIVPIRMQESQFIDLKPIALVDSLISPSWILTAANCDKDNEIIEVLVNASKSGLDPGGIPVNVTEKIAHPFFNPATFENDFLLLKLAAPIAIEIEPIALNSNPYFPKDGQQITVIGTGVVTS
jgi:secreted trypsin-like serine protease